MIKTLLLASTLLIPTAALASSVTVGGETFDETGAAPLVLQNFVPPGNQPTNIPCVICGEHQPQQPPTFGYTNFGNTGNQTTINYFSTDTIGGGNPGANTISNLNYSDSFLKSFLLGIGDKNFGFTIGVDVNDSGPMHPQTLSQFLMLDLTTRTVLAFLPGPVLVPAVNNGTGHPDYTLAGFNGILSHINPTDSIAFFSSITNANDGPDQFFLEAGPTAQTPLPASFWLFGPAFTGMVSLALRRKKVQHG